MSTSQISPNEKLDRAIRARYPIIAILSHEEARVISAVNAIAGTQTKMAPKGRKVVEWTYTRGLIGLEGLSDPEMTSEPVGALSAILDHAPLYEETAQPHLFVFKDMHYMIQQDPKVIRYLRDLAVAFGATHHNIILLSPTFEVPQDLDKTVMLIDWPLPTYDELDQIVRRAETNLAGSGSNSLNGGRERLVQSLSGLTAFEAESAILSAFVATKGQFSETMIPFVVKEKAQIIKKAGVLEYYDTDVKMGDVGGLEHLKQYAMVNRKAFSAEAKAAGVDTPKGVLLVGVPGTGKSLSAKAIAGGAMPLLRLDIGAVMAGHVGESEGNMRTSLKVAEAVAPCVLWLDEIEKALKGTNSDGDSGVSARVFGTLLTWMQETTAPVYVVATANDVRQLRPELLRRFDDIFWVDLPALQDRADILKVHLEKRGYSLPAETLEAIAADLHGLSGAEIEKVVKTAIKRAFFAGESLADGRIAEYIAGATGSVIPVSVTMDNEINELRAWAKTRALPAAEPLEPKPLNQKSAAARTVDL